MSQHTLFPKRALRRSPAQRGTASISFWGVGLRITPCGILDGILPSCKKMLRGCYGILPFLVGSLLIALLYGDC